MKRRKRLFLVISVLVFLIAIGTGVAGYFSFFRKNADTISAPQYISSSATISYEDENGQEYSEQSNTAVVRKVNLFPLLTSLKGRSASSAANLSLEFFDHTNASAGQTLRMTLGPDGRVVPDWTTLPNIDADKTYDIRVLSPGFLSRKVTDIIPGSQSDDVNAGFLRAGDLNQDQKINIDDYASWKLKYGQSGDNMPEDFNGDGNVNIFDFGMSFGSRCYNATESNQDSWCNQ